MKPKISICIPTLNRAHMLRQAVESVLANTCQDFEVVISDNCSTDDTERVVNALKDERIRYFRQNEQVPIVANWSAVLFHARGKCAMKLDDDDSIEPEFIARTVAFLDAHPEVSIVFTAHYVDHPSGQREVMIDRGFFGDRSVAPGLEYCRAILLHERLPVNHKSAGVFRLGAARQIDFFNLCREDVLFTTAMAAQGDVGYIPTPLFHYNISHTGQHQSGRIVEVAESFMEGLSHFFSLEVVRQNEELISLRDIVLEKHQTLIPLFYTNLAFRGHDRKMGLAVTRYFVRRNPRLLRNPLLLLTVVTGILLPPRSLLRLTSYYYAAHWPKKIVNTLAGKRQ